MMAQAEISTRDDSGAIPLGFSISRWRRQRLDLRRQLLKLLSCELLPMPGSELSSVLQALSTGLLDYLSTGHFEIYGKVLRACKMRDPELRRLLRHIFHNLGSSTDAVLAFNENLDYLQAAGLRRELFDEMNRLARALLLRFVLEEQLLELAENPPQGSGVDFMEASF